MVPMAISLAWGVLFATFITLLLVPVNTMILDDIKRALKTYWRWQTNATDGAEGVCGNRTTLIHFAGRCSLCSRVRKNVVPA